MRVFIAAIVIILFTTSGCVPSRNVVDSSRQENIDTINKQLEGKMVEIRRMDESSIKARDVTVVRYSLYYTRLNGQQSLALSQVRSVLYSPKLSVSTLPAAPLFIIGIYGIATFNDKGGSEELGKIYGGAAAITLGGIIYVIGNSTERIKLNAQAESLATEVFLKLRNFL